MSFFMLTSEYVKRILAPSGDIWGSATGAMGNMGMIVMSVNFLMRYQCTRAFTVLSIFQITWRVFEGVACYVSLDEPVVFVEVLFVALLA